MLYNNIMPRWKSVPRFFPLLALTFFLLGASYLVTHLMFPYDGARLEPGQQAWLPNGILVSPLTGKADGLQTDDLILAVEGTRIDQFAESLVRFKFLHKEPHFDQVVEYSILRNGVEMDIRASQTTYPGGALLARYWGIYVVVLTLQAIMTYVLIRRPTEPAAQVLFVLAWSLWHFPAWTIGLQVSDIVNGWGYWHYRAATLLPYLLTFSAMLHLSLVFPRHHPLLDRTSRLVPIIYIAPYALFGIFMTIANFFTSNTWTWLGDWNTGEWAVSILYVSVFIVVTILNYQTVPDEGTRVKIRWVVFGGSVSAAGIVLFWLFPGVILGQPIIPAGAIALLALPVPLTLAVAIMRYKLFDIDFIIRKTLQYALLTALLVLVYFGSVILLQSLVENLTGSQSPLVIVLSTLAIAALFNPLRTRVQDLIDRRFYRNKYDAEQALSKFAAAARDEVDMDRLTTALLGVVEETMQPEQVSLWLKKEGR